MTDPIYAIGDIHGQLAMLDAALARIEADGGAAARVVFLGDYTDRGPASRQVLDRLIDGQARGRNWTFLRGNHDRMFSMFLETYPRTDSRLLIGYHWLHPRIGGVETLASYGIDIPDGTRIHALHDRVAATIPPAHRTFLDGLQDHLETDDLLFVHAGIRPGLALADQSQDDKLWIRSEFLDDRRSHPWLVVHGHTHVPAPEHHGNRVNLNSGAGYGHPLTTAVFEGRACWHLTETGRQPLMPKG